MTDHWKSIRDNTWVARRLRYRAEIEPVNHDLEILLVELEELGMKIEEKQGEAKAIFAKHRMEEIPDGLR